MGPTWMDAQFVLNVYQAFLTLLVWFLAIFACFGVLVSVLLLIVECRLRSADMAPEHANRLASHGLRQALSLRSFKFTDPAQ